ncbi:MATE family efflux transporter [Numidum massiliense]|uniref:MATE family efflux transporter n=1 Tax=Numidum massiliense TaxID=1522315 RepID=UPI0006D53BCE|nr:MATE family efflux transporter [Numidum massiliense]
MEQTFSLRQKARQLFIILLPILVTQLTLYAMNFFDTVMSGHASAADLAGVAIGSSLWVPVFTGLNGILLALTPIVAQFVGAARTERVPFTVQQGVYLALAISVLVIACGALVLQPILNGMDLEDGVRYVALHYLIALACGIVPLFVYTVFRCFIDALGETRVTMVLTLLTLPINIGLNYVLIFGKLGFPRLGGIGAGYASAVTYWCIASFAWYVLRRRQPFATYRLFSKWHNISLAAWKEQLKLGVPIGLAIFFETSIFSAVTLLMSRFRTITIAAHQSALNFASFLYMVPMSVSMALTIAVGFEVGAKRPRDAKTYSYIGIAISLVVAICCALALFIFNEQVAYLYTNEPTVLELTRQFLMYAIFFQLSDAIAAPIQGALRGYKDVNATFALALISYWGVGLPLGYVLATYTSLGAFGYWIGLISGLAAGAVGLLWRLLAIQRRHETLVGGQSSAAKV